MLTGGAVAPIVLDTVPDAGGQAGDALTVSRARWAVTRAASDARATSSRRVSALGHMKANRHMWRRLAALERCCSAAGNSDAVEA